MKKLEFLITVPDKYTGKQYEAGKQYEFEDKRADEILAARTTVTKEPYAVEVVETEHVENVENTVESVDTGDNTGNKTQEEKPKRKRKTKND